MNRIEEIEKELLELTEKFIYSENHNFKLREKMKKLEDELKELEEELIK